MRFRQWFEAVQQRGIILVATGAYNPVHRGHIKVFYHAKRYLASIGYNVVGAYMIPRNPDYIQRKSAAKGETPVEDTHRQQMIQLATQGTFIKVLPLEQEKPNQSRQDLRGIVQQMHPGNEIVWVAGDDKAQCPQGDICLQELPGWGKTIIVGRNLAGDASSTQVRQNLIRIGDEPKLLSPGVRSYVQQQGLWGARKAV